MIFISLIGLVTIVICIYLTITLAFSSKDHSQYDLPTHARFGTGEEGRMLGLAPVKK